MPWKPQHDFPSKRQTMPINRTKVKPGHSPWRPNINPGDAEVHQCHHYSSIIKRLCDACLEMETKQQTRNSTNKQKQQITNITVTNYIQDL